jgi:class 3 adenylate cyclase
MLRPLKFTWDLLRRIYTHYDTLPPAVERENSRFYTVANLAQTIAWAAHFSWFFVFYSLEIYPLAWIQFGSVALHVLAIVFNRHGHHMTSMSISMVELVIHQAIAVKLIGAEAGFQFYIPVVGIFPFLLPRGNVVWKSMLLLLAVAGFMLIEMYYVNQVPMYRLDETPTLIFRIVNISACFGLTAMWAYYLNIGIYRGEVILERRIREVADLEKKAEQSKLEYDLQVKERDNEIFRLRNIELEDEKNKSRSLLLNILPEETADELMNSGKASSRRYDSATVLFADFVGFSSKSEKLEPEELINRIDIYFTAFDRITAKHNIEKIKTIGDAYMAVGGLPVANETHVTDVVNAAIEMLTFVNNEKNKNPDGFDIRIGIHTGTLVAGVVGRHKFQYDIWGDTVNVAARMEQNSEVGKINISGAVYELISKDYKCTSRGPIEVKNKGKIDMFFLEEKVSVAL